MKMLDLSDNCFGDSGFIAISSCITKIEELEIGNLYDNNITKKGITALTDALSSSTTKVRVILSGLKLHIAKISQTNILLASFYVPIPRNYKNILIFRKYFILFTVQILFIRHQAVNGLNSEILIA